MTDDDLSHHRLVQWLSVAVQRGNCASVLGSARSGDVPCLFAYLFYFIFSYRSYSIALYYIVMCRIQIK